MLPVQVALGQRPQLSVYGSDYPTPDGTCVRDYIHVMDLAEGHTAACDKLFASPGIGCVAYNLGTGTGSSVLEMIKVHTCCCLSHACPPQCLGMALPAALTACTAARCVLQL